MKNKIIQKWRFGGKIGDSPTPPDFIGAKGIIKNIYHDIFNHTQEYIWIEQNVHVRLPMFLIAPKKAQKGG